MKNIFLFVIIFSIQALGSVFAQSTPNCNDLDSDDISYPAPLTEGQVEWVEDQIESQFPNVYVFEGATSSYNCHNYAWVKSMGGGLQLSIRA